MSLKDKIEPILLSEEQAMKLAIDEASKGLGYVAPNPPVGCVVLDKDSRLIGKGYHRKAGGAHAEVEAINSIENRDKLKGAKVLVTLEPCAHFGKTPPCSDLLASLPIRKLVYGSSDPNPLVLGKGLEKLRASGIEVEKWEGSFQEELNELIEVFVTNVIEGRAFIALKAAVTLDGFLADKKGESQWITNSSSRDQVHFLRAIYQSVLVGANTLRIDNPRLNVRSPLFSEKRNQVVILDPEMVLGRNFSEYQISQVHSADEIIQVLSRAHFSSSEPVAHHQLFFDLRNSQFDLNHLSKQLYSRMGICSVLVEGGALTYSHYLEQKAADRLYLFFAPKILGCRSGLSWTHGYGGKNLDLCAKLERSQFRTFNGDMLVSGRFII